MAPTLLLVIAIAGLVFGRDAAQGAVVDQLSGLMGRDTAEALQAMIRSAGDRMTGVVATLIGLVTIFLAASGVFGEVQSALNAIWKAKSTRSTLSRLVRAAVPAGAHLNLPSDEDAAIAVLRKALEGLLRHD